MEEEKQEDIVGADMVINRGRNRISSIEQEHYYIPTIDGEKLPYVAESYDMALLLALGYKHDGNNSKFASFAARMLKIDSVWAK